jgi:hypothetical protein
MKSPTLFAAALILLAPLLALAFQAQSEQVRKGELKSRPFTAGPLKITLTRFYGGGLLQSNGYIDIEVENTSDDFTTFDPRRMGFIDNDDNQSDIFGLVLADRNRSIAITDTNPVVAAEDKRIGPKARIKRLYALTDKVRLPARLYYEDKLLGTIIE